jgi:hypothetical protein
LKLCGILIFLKKSQKTAATTDIRCSDQLELNDFLLNLILSVKIQGDTQFFRHSKLDNAIVAKGRNNHQQMQGANRRDADMVLFVEVSKEGFVAFLKVFQVSYPIDTL